MVQVSGVSRHSLLASSPFTAANVSKIAANGDGEKFPIAEFRTVQQTVGSAGQLLAGAGLGLTGPYSQEGPKTAFQTEISKICRQNQAYREGYDHSDRGNEHDAGNLGFTGAVLLGEED